MIAFETNDAIVYFNWKLSINWKLWHNFVKNKKHTRFVSDYSYCLCEALYLFICQALEVYQPTINHIELIKIVNFHVYNNVRIAKVPINLRPNQICQPNIPFNLPRNLIFHKCTCLKCVRVKFMLELCDAIAYWRGNKFIMYRVMQTHKHCITK